MAEDKAHVWHPFTPMAEWCAPGHETLMIAGGEGTYLIDSNGKRYLDGNASIWTNIHGHSHPTIVAAIQEQAAQLAHASSLGFGSAPAAELAARLCSFFPRDTLTKVFYSDDGSTAVECALRMALQFWQQSGAPQRTQFVAFDRAYHGDTIGAASLGGIPLFHKRLAGFGLPTLQVRELDALKSLAKDQLQTIAGVVIEPLIQGAAGMRTWPSGMLRALRAWCDRHGILLILDEVMTGFGRTGTMFACQREDVIPDFLALAKGLTGGTMPVAVTMTTDKIFEAFLDPKHTFYYGHSYSGNPLGCAAALANLQVFKDEQVLEKLPAKIAFLNQRLTQWQSTSNSVSGFRQCGLIAGIDIKQANGMNFDPKLRMGAQICLKARHHGLLTRPVLDTLVLMPPLCVTESQIDKAVSALQWATAEVLN